MIELYKRKLPSVGIDEKHSVKLRITKLFDNEIDANIYLGKLNKLIEQILN